jgi:aminomethyltransferase
MPVPTPFHPRTAAACESYLWRDWAGYAIARRYQASHEPEYLALRHACGLLDVSPLFKYLVSGRDAARFLSFVLCRDAARLKPGQVAYSTWCDDRGKVLDDGTLARLDESRFRLTSAEPSLAWLARLARGFDVALEDASARTVALAIQGPAARDVLVSACGPEVARIRYFHHARAAVDGVPVEITRTGYTGDLGYELWLDAGSALPVWDALRAHGRPFGLVPVGLDALDVARLEAGFVLQGVDYFSARDCLLEERMCTPFELGLGWTVQMDRGAFVGEAALAADRRAPPRRAVVGLEIDVPAIEGLFARFDLPPELPHEAWRVGRPVRAGARQIGRATSGVWSPTLKKYIALATVDAPFAAAGTRVAFETTIECERHFVGATVVERPFFSPERKRA